MSKLSYLEQQKVDSYFNESVKPLINDIHSIITNLDTELIHAIFLGSRL